MNIIRKKLVIVGDGLVNRKINKKKFFFIKHHLFFKEHVVKHVFYLLFQKIHF